MKRLSVAIITGTGICGHKNLTSQHCKVSGFAILKLARLQNI